MVQANLLASFASGEDAGLVYNVAYGQSTTLNQLFEMIRAEVSAAHPAAANISPVYRDFRAGDVRHSLANIDLARTRLGYEPQFGPAEGLKLASAWYINNL